MIRRMPPPLIQRAPRRRRDRRRGRSGTARWFRRLALLALLWLCGVAGYILHVGGRDDAAEVEGPSFDQVYAQLEEERVGRAARRYLRDLRRDAIVDYR
jgi:hypothetical protein